MSKDLSKMIENSIDTFYPKSGQNFSDILTLFKNKESKFAMNTFEFILRHKNIELSYLFFILRN